VAVFANVQFLHLLAVSDELFISVIVGFRLSSMTNVFSGTLNPTHFTSLRLSSSTFLTYGINVGFIYCITCMAVTKIFEFVLVTSDGI